MAHPENRHRFTAMAQNDPRRSSAANPSAAPTAPSSLQARGDIVVRLWVRVDDNQSLFSLEFDTVSGGRDGIFIPRSNRRDPSKVLRLLDDAGAKLLNDDVAQKLGRQLNADLPPNFLVSTPGDYRGKFVPARLVEHTRDDQERPCLVRTEPTAASAYVGHLKGTSEGWRRSVGEIARHSTMMSFSVFTALAAPLAARVGLSEGTLFNLFGVSTSGKTTCARVCASVGGDPDQIGTYHATGRGQEEQAAACNGYANIADDTEKLSSDAKVILKTIIHVVTGGQSKGYSVTVKNSLRPLRWFCFGLSTSPVSMDELVRRAGEQPTPGNRVRLIDVQFPTPDQGGLFDRANPSKVKTLTQRQSIIARIDRGMKDNHGQLFEEWRQKVLDHITPDAVANRVDAMMDSLPQSNPIEGRILRKLAVVAVAGDLAIEHGILTWPQRQPRAVVAAVWDRVRQELARERTGTVGPWLELRKALADPRRMPRLEASGVFPGQHSNLLGVRRFHRGCEVYALYSSKLQALLGREEAGSLVAKLHGMKALHLAPGCSKTSTLQLPVRVASTAMPHRERSYVVEVTAFDKVLATQCRLVAQPETSRSVTAAVTRPTPAIGPSAKPVEHSSSTPRSVHSQRSVSPTPQRKR